MIIVSECDHILIRIFALLKRDIPQANLFIAPLTNGAVPYIGSIGRKSIAIEVGPVAQGVLSNHALALTESATNSIINAIECLNLDPGKKIDETIEIFRPVGFVPLSKKDDFFDAFIHDDIDKQDYQVISKGCPLLQKFDGSIIRYEGEDEVWPVFINEAAYYAEGKAMILTSKEKIYVE